jgi:diguanylate cyclase (GGDEF)-like protein
MCGVFSGSVDMRIVLVDASRIVLKIITGLLEARSHVVHPFTDGQDALNFIASNLTVDGLITSIQLPSMSGLELCWETRLLSTYSRPIYIIVMSSSYDQRKLTEALDSGADDFIGKPTVSEELYARLRAAERLALMQQELVRLATIDPLTGIMNRRAFFERAKSVWPREASDCGISAIMLDIDHFKQVNDVHGHGVGDEVIRSVAKAASAEAEIVGRLGGEEFAILVVHRALVDVMELAERLRFTIAALQFETGPQPLKTTCSFGVSERRLDDNIDQLLNRADRALYQAKQSGRNRVIAADPAVSPTVDGERTGVIRLAPRCIGDGRIDGPSVAMR